MNRGTVSWFNDGMGYGFIKGDDGIDRFVHYSAIISDAKRRMLLPDQRVEFEPIESERGPAASQVKVVTV